jgi:hypothetical protein
MSKRVHISDGRPWLPYISASFSDFAGFWEQSQLILTALPPSVLAMFELVIGNPEPGRGPRGESGD